MEIIGVSVTRLPCERWHTMALETMSETLGIQILKIFLLFVIAIQNMLK